MLLEVINDRLLHELTWEGKVSDCGQFCAVKSLHLIDREIDWDLIGLI